MFYILENTNQMPYHTYIDAIFDSFSGLEKDYNWLITDFELNHYLPTYENKEKIWISGEELSAILQDNPTQFIWGVLSGFKKNIEIDVNNLEIDPYADGNNFWTRDINIQHPKATIEIVCFDSSLTLLFSKDEEISKRFKSKFSDAIDLMKYNS